MRMRMRMGMGMGMGGAAATGQSSAASNMRPFSDNTTRGTIAQYNADADLLARFDQSDGSGKSFDYSRSVLSAPNTVSEEKISAYLSIIQRGGHVQSFGCMLALQDPTLRVIGYSDNCFDLLGLGSESCQGGSLIGVDAGSLFTPPSSASLAKAAASREMSLSNPVWVYTRTTRKPFYAILHRIDVGIVVDLEPARFDDPALSLACAVQSQKLAVRAISRLQSLPGGDIGVLCDSVAEDVQKLTGYDRVMVYKFHDDDHGEVVSEVRRSDLEPYLGLHYPATDIPQAARFLFKQNRVRIICDCHANPVKVIQSEELKQPLCLVNSTLRSPHACHNKYMVNMGSIASLAMAVVVNGKDSSKLWGLVVCHHTSSRYVPFPLRYACEFLMQAFSLQLNMELQMAAQLAEKKILKMQTLLCDLLLRDAPLSIVTQSPSIMDLVKCDGAALYYEGKCWLLGVTPTELQVKDIVEWLLSSHGDSTGLSTDSLADAGYPDATSLGNAVCGMAAAKITSKDFLFWFRSHTAKEVRWGGAKHHPEEKDDGGRMHPRSSFNAFLEMVKSQSLPWEVPEINAIQSLQLILRQSFQDKEESGLKATTCTLRGNTDVQSFGELGSVACEMVRLIESATVPIFGVDSAGLVNGWNAKVAELTGLQASVAMRKSLVREIVHQDSQELVDNMLCRALLGEKEKNVELKLRKFGPYEGSPVVYIVVNACTSRDYTGKTIGVCFVGQDVTSEKVLKDKFFRLEGDYLSILQSPSPFIPPIFAADENACCSEWNAAMEKLTGWRRHEVIGKVLPGEIFGDMCQLNGQDSLTRFMILLYQGITGQETEKFPFGFSNRDGKYVELHLTSSRRTDAAGNVIGCFCFLQMVQPSLQQSPEAPVQDDTESWKKSKELAYIQQAIRSPLCGIRFTHKLLETTAIVGHRKQFLQTSDACQRQIMLIIDDSYLRGAQEGNVELNAEEFILGNVVDAIVSQVMILSKERNVQLLQEVPEEMKMLSLFGDKIRLQLVMSNFLTSVVRYAAPDSWAEIKISNGLKLIQNGDEFIHLQFRMTHPGHGLPATVIQDMFETGSQWKTQDGQGLSLSRKLLNTMKGDVQYRREHTSCYFVVDIEVKVNKGRKELFQGDTSRTSLHP